MKILILTQKVDKNDDNLGFFCDWIQNFGEKFEKVQVVCLGKGQYEFEKNISIYSLGKENNVSRLTYIIRFFRYIIALRKEYDVVFVHMNPEYVILGSLFWNIWNKKVALWYTHKSVDLKLRIAEFLTDIIFTASKESFRLQSDKLHIMGHGITVPDMNRKNPVSVGGDIKLLTTGRISRSKNIHIMIEVVNTLKKEGVDVRLDIVGGPVDEEGLVYLREMEDFVAKQGLTSSISFVGPVPHDEIDNYLKKADIFLNLSSTGSLDKAVLEAMAIGVLPVTSNEAFFSMLDMYTQYLITDATAGSVSEKIKTVIHVEETKKQEMQVCLRDMISTRHSLPVLIDNIKKVYETGR